VDRMVAYGNINFSMLVQMFLFQKIKLFQFLVWSERLGLSSTLAKLLIYFIKVSVKNSLTSFSASADESLL